MDDRISAQYARGDLRQRLLDAIVAAGLDPSRLTADDLATADEFHTGGRQATVDLIEQLPIGPDSRVLDVGCGVGGASRFVAARHGCQVTGVDLTREYVELAGYLAGRMGLADRVRYHQSDALGLSFAPESFDLAYMMHVGMNIADKAALCREMARVVAPGGHLAIYDIMRVGPGEYDYPVPWADSPEISFVGTPAEYQAALVAAGFEVVETRARAEFALEFFARLRAAMAAGGPPPLGLHLLVGPDIAVKVANLVGGIEGGSIAPVEIIARRG